MKTPTRRRSGFLLVNLLLVLGLLAAFSVLAERIARLSLQTLSKTTAEQDDMIRLERALHQMREDIWNAASIETIDKTHVRVTGDQKNIIDWQTSKTGDLNRAEGNDQLRWADLNLNFERQGPWLVLRRGGAEVALFQQAKSTGGTR